MRAPRKKKKDGDTIGMDEFEGSWSAVPHEVQRSEAYKRLSRNAKALMLDVIGMLDGKNNGALCLARSQMREFGWQCHKMLKRAIDELVSAGFIVQTRSWRFKPARAALFAVTWFHTQYCTDKHGNYRLEVKWTGKPYRLWRDDEDTMKLKSRIHAERSEAQLKQSPWLKKGEHYKTPKATKFEKDPLAEYRRPVRGSVKHVAQVEREHESTVGGET